MPKNLTRIVYQCSLIGTINRRIRATSRKNGTSLNNYIIEMVEGEDVQITPINDQSDPKNSLI
jgi:hypothetical protein